MEYVRLGNTGLKVSRICLGTMTYGTPAWRPWVLDEAASRPFIARALEHGINFFDTADMYSRGVSEEVARPRARRAGQPRSGRHRHQGVLSAARRPEPARPVAQAPLRRHRRLAAPARHRLRRPLPDPPLRLRHADRGNARGAPRHRQGRQGALHRRVEHVRLAVREDAATSPTRTAGRGSCRCRTTTTWSTARKSARCCRSAARRASA